MLRYPPFHILVYPRVSWTWDEFVANAPEYSIAFDGMVKGGPRYDEKTHRLNVDHHDGVVREATMSTCMQVFMALKGGLMQAYARDPVHLCVNDTDQDTALSLWEMLNYKLLEGTQSIPHVNRLIALTDRLDITGGAFPMNLRDDLIRRHSWIFRPYTDLRKSGALASASAEVMESNLQAVFTNLNRFMMGEGEMVELDIRHLILHDSPRYKIVDEIGGNEARYHLFSQGMDAFVSLVARRPDGRFVYSIGRRSRYINFPVPRLYAALNEAEGLPQDRGWNGSDIVGGSPRGLGSALPWERIREVLDPVVNEA